MTISNHPYKDFTEDQIEEYFLEEEPGLLSFFNTDFFKRHLDFFQSTIDVREIEKKDESDISDEEWERLCLFDWKLQNGGFNPSPSPEKTDLKTTNDQKV